jgi:hypothetical protein
MSLEFQAKGNIDKLPPKRALEVGGLEEEGLRGLEGGLRGLEVVLRGLGVELKGLEGGLRGLEGGLRGLKGGLGLRGLLERGLLEDWEPKMSELSGVAKTFPGLLEFPKTLMAARDNALCVLVFLAQECHRQVDCATMGSRSRQSLLVRNKGSFKPGSHSTHEQQYLGHNS